jgi:glucose/arabinose dehydrogenase
MLKHRVSLMVLALAVALPALATAQSGAMGKEEQQVLQAEKDRFAAMVKVDEAVLNKLLSDDLTYIHSTALLQTKKEFIASLKEGGIKYVSVVPSAADWKVRIAGTVAVVTGLAAVHVLDHGNDRNIRIRYTDIHTNRAGSWQLVNWQSTVIP